MIKMMIEMVFQCCNLKWCFNATNELVLHSTFIFLFACTLYPTYEPFFLITDHKVFRKTLETECIYQILNWVSKDESFSLYHEIFPVMIFH